MTTKLGRILAKRGMTADDLYIALRSNKCNWSLTSCRNWVMGRHEPCSRAVADIETALGVRVTLFL